jgi:hypothetical protein
MIRLWLSFAFDCSFFASQDFINSSLTDCHSFQVTLFNHFTSEMRLHIFLWVLSVSQSAVAGPVKRDGALSEEQIVNALVKNPSLVPPEGMK